MSVNVFNRINGINKIVFYSILFNYLTIMLLLVLLLLALLIYVIYRIFRKTKIQVEYNPNGNVSKYVEQMKTIKETYQPTPWLIGPHIHTVYGMRYRKRSKITNKCRREEFILSDKGTSALDYFEPENAKENSPFVVICLL